MHNFKKAIFAYQEFLNNYEVPDNINDKARSHYLKRTNRAKYYLGNLYQKIGKTGIATSLVKAYYKLVNVSQEELYQAGLPFYTSLEEEYSLARKYGKKLCSL